jgi:hypothetical protein
MQKICHVERFICTETPVEADGIQTFFFSRCREQQNDKQNNNLGATPSRQSIPNPEPNGWYSFLFTVWG